MTFSFQYNKKVRSYYSANQDLSQEFTMKSTITSKFQTTIPKAIREGLKLSIHDTLDWELKNGKVTLKPTQCNFLLHKNTLHVGEGCISEDISEAKMRRAEKYK
jgi:AbrB family looped-hinge helix DNA binding protein